MDFHTPEQLLAFLRAAETAARAGKDRFLCPVCRKEASIAPAPFGWTANCPVCGITAPVDLCRRPGHSRPQKDPAAASGRRVFSCRQAPPPRPGHTTGQRSMIFIRGREL